MSPAIATQKTAQPAQPAFALPSVRASELVRAGYVAQVFRLSAAQPTLSRCTIINLILVVNHKDPNLSERSLWRWVAKFERAGLMGLCDRKAGRSGRKKAEAQS